MTISSDQALDKSADPPDGALVRAGVVSSAPTGVTQVVVASSTFSEGVLHTLEKPVSRAAEAAKAAGTV